MIQFKCKKIKNKNLHHVAGSTTTYSNYYSFPCRLQKSICPGLPNVLPFVYEHHASLKARVVLFIFVYLLPRVCFPHFIRVAAQRARVQSHFSLHAAWNGAPVSLHCLLALSLLPSSSLPVLLPSFSLFPSSFSFYLPSFLPLFFFSDLEFLSLGHWTIYAYLDTQACPTLCNSMDCSLRGQAPLSMEFSRKEYCSGFPFLTPGDIPDSVSFVFCTDPHILKHSVTWEALNSILFLNCPVMVLLSKLIRKSRAYLSLRFMLNPELELWNSSLFRVHAQGSIVDKQSVRKSKKVSLADHTWWRISKFKKQNKPNTQSQLTAWPEMQ